MDLEQARHRITERIGGRASDDVGVRVEIVPGGWQAVELHNRNPILWFHAGVDLHPDGRVSRLRGAARALTGVRHYFWAPFISELEVAARAQREALGAGIALLRAVNAAQRLDADGWNGSGCQHAGSPDGHWGQAGRRPTD